MIDANQRRPILLLGAQGQLGAELRRELATLGELVATARPKERRATRGFHTLDVTDPGALRQLVDEVRPGVIVNAVAYTAVDRAESDPAMAEAVNATAVAELAAEAKQVNAAVIHFSTDYVFSGSTTHPWTEDDTPRPFNAYGRTKLAGEDAIRRSGATHLILRTSWLYGVAGENFVKTMLRLGRERPTLRVVNDQTGVPTSAALVARAVRRILDQCPRDLPYSEWIRTVGGTYHLTCGGQTTWWRFAQVIFDQARQLRFPLAVERVEPISSREYGAAAERPEYSCLDCSRMERTFGIRLPEWETAFAEVFPKILAAVKAELP